MFAFLVALLLCCFLALLLPCFLSLLSFLALLPPTPPRVCARECMRSPPPAAKSALFHDVCNVCRITWINIARGHDRASCLSCARGTLSLCSLVLELCSRCARVCRVLALVLFVCARCVRARGALALYSCLSCDRRCVRARGALALFSCLLCARVVSVLVVRSRCSRACRVLALCLCL